MHSGGEECLNLMLVNMWMILHVDVASCLSTLISMTRGITETLQQFTCISARDAALKSQAPVARGAGAARHFEMHFERRNAKHCALHRLDSYPGPGDSPSNTCCRAKPSTQSMWNGCSPISWQRSAAPVIPRQSMCHQSA